jgi:16S rRNA G527 N7-methylase RsmG
LNIELYYIPAEAIDKLQPLDHVTSRAFKSAAEWVFWCWNETDRRAPRNKAEVAHDIMQVWADITEDVVGKGWYFDKEWKAK